MKRTISKFIICIVVLLSGRVVNAESSYYDLDVGGTAAHLNDRRTTPFSLKSQFDDVVAGLAFADSGVAGVAASAGVAGSTEGSTRNISATASSTFQDVIRIDVPGLDDTTGSVTVRLNSTFIVIGNSANDVLAAGGYSVFFGSSGGESDSFQYLFGSNDGDDIPYLVPTQITSPFIFGHDFIASLNASSAAALSSGPTPQFASVGHAIGFGAILEIRDSDGNLVPLADVNAESGFATDSSTAATVTSQLGIDYLVDHDLPTIDLSVPEPHSILLVALCAGLGIRQREPKR